jgi:RhoGEF domain
LDQETERRPDSRKLELNAYLTKPTTRLARYPLLLEAVLKQTPDESSDKHEIPKVVTLVREFLAEVNRETGRSENRFNLLQLEQQLLFRPGEQVVRTSSSDLILLVVDLCTPLGSAVKGRGSRNDLQGPSETSRGLARRQRRIIGLPA